MNQGFFGFPSGHILALIRVRHFTASGTYVPSQGASQIVVELASASNSTNFRSRAVAFLPARGTPNDVVVGASAGAASTFRGQSSGTAGGSGGTAGWVTIYEFGP